MDNTQGAGWQTPLWKATQSRRTYVEWWVSVVGALPMAFRCKPIVRQRLDFLIKKPDH